MKKFRKILLVSGAIFTPASLAVTTVSCGHKGGSQKTDWKTFEAKAHKESAWEIAKATTQTAWKDKTNLSITKYKAYDDDHKIFVHITNSMDHKVGTFEIDYIGKVYSVHQWRNTTPPTDPHIEAWVNYSKAAEDIMSTSEGVKTILELNQSVYGHFIVVDSWITALAIKDNKVFSAKELSKDEVEYIISFKISMKGDAANTVTVKATMTLKNLTFKNSDLKIQGVADESSNFNAWVTSATNLISTQNGVAIIALQNLVDVMGRLDNKTKSPNLTTIDKVLTLSGSKFGDIKVKLKSDPKLFKADLAKGTITFSGVDIVSNDGLKTYATDGIFLFRWTYTLPTEFNPTVARTSTDPNPDKYEIQSMKEMIAKTPTLTKLNFNKNLNNE